MAKSYFNRPALEAIQKACLDLGQRKNADYGSAGDAIGMAGAYGVVVRMLDKQMRLLSLSQPGAVAQVKDESIRDTAMDMINYATYLISILDGTWGVQPEEPNNDLPILDRAKADGSLHFKNTPPPGYRFLQEEEFFSGKPIPGDRMWNTEKKHWESVGSNEYAFQLHTIDYYVRQIV